RVIWPHAPADRQREHLTRDRHDAVSLGRLARLGDLAMKPIEVRPGHLGDFEATERWPEVALEHIAVVVLGVGTLAADMLGEEARDQLVDGRGAARGRDLGHRVAAAIDVTLKPARLLAGANDRPVGEIADGVAPAPTGMGAVVENEGAVPGGGHPRAEA